MRIAIYGDSYGITTSVPDRWTEALSKKLNVKIDNYSVSGSSVYYSYKMFMSTKDNYDVVLFLVTDPLRYPLEINFTDSVPKTRKRVTGLAAVEYLRNAQDFSLTPIDEKMLNDVEGWYKASDLGYIFDVNTLFLEKILASHPNVILYPCFPNSIPPEYLQGFDIKYSMFNLFVRQLKLLGIKPTQENMLRAGETENTQVIGGHLVPEFNRVLTEVMYDRIVDNVWNLHKLDTVTALPHSKEYYYEIT